MAKAVGFTGIKSDWTASGGRLVFTRENASVGIEWGKDGSGIDNTWFGDTSGAYMMWDESADDLLLVNAEARIASASVTNLVVGGTASFSGNVRLGDASTDSIGFFGATATKQISFASTNNGLADALVALGLMSPSA